MPANRTKTERAIREIRARILNRDLRPGEALRQGVLASEMQLGITPVREALLQLASEGLVTKIPYVGVVVADMTSESTHQIYEVRRLLESYAARQACVRATHADVGRLRQLVAQMAAAQAAGDYVEYQRVNQSFHMMIYAMCGNPVLAEIIAAQWRRFPRDTLALMSHRMAQSLEEHERILEAFERRDADYVEALMTAHIAAAEYEVAAYIAEQRPARRPSIENRGGPLEGNAHPIDTAEPREALAREVVQ
jgi:DNA-binding GntR family transcriptional regulator